MNRRRTSYYKALLLLTVFSLNTLVSFACSLGGLFHDLHHSNTVTANVPHHDHHKGKNGAHEHDHENMGQQHHHSEHNNTSKDDCCSNNVIEVEKQVKWVSRTIEAPGIELLTSVVYSCSSFFQLFLVQDKVLYPDIRWRFPTTIQNIRIVIQSFQI